MSALTLNAKLVALSVFLYLAALAMNEWVFLGSEFTRGINWIYLPAGVRLVTILLFGGAGALGVLLASLLATLLYYFPDDLPRALSAAIVSAAAPYLVYLAAQKCFGLRPSLVNLNAARLTQLMLAYALAGPLMQHVVLWLRGGSITLAGLVVMVIGDLLGSFAVLAVIKLGLVLLPLAKKTGRAGGP